MSAALNRKPAAGENFGASGGHRFYDASTGVWMVKVLPGEYHVTAAPQEVLVTILGSCVAACIRDPIAGVGGMNHFMLPQSAGGSWGDQQNSTRFGNFAMEKLINELLKAGCSRSSLEIKVFGGGNVIDSSSAVGSRNAEFVLRYLQDEGLKCFAQDLEGRFPRRIQYNPVTGRVVRKLLGTSETSNVTREETEYASRLTTQKTSGDIELFD